MQTNTRTRNDTKEPARTRLYRGLIASGAAALCAALIASIASIAIGDDTPGTALRAIGASCADVPDGTQCAYPHLCLDVSPLGSVCATYCETSSDCTLEGYGCHRLREPTGKEIGICSPYRIGAGG